MSDQPDEKENGIIFWITEEGKVLLRPNSFIQPSSWNAMPIMEKIGPEAISFMEYLIWKYRKELKEELETE
jgi:hypothetical protein